MRVLPILLALAAIGQGCLFLDTRVQPPPLAIRTATLGELLSQLERFEPLETIRAEVDLGLSFLNDDMDRMRTLKDVRGYILAKRPSNARIQAQYPVTHQKAFDMVADDKEFSVYLVWDKRFLQGETALDVRSDKRAENVRPQHVVAPLLIKPPQSDERAAMDNITRNRRTYHVVVFRKTVGDHEVITRKAWFDRATLDLSILEIYDGEGNVVTSAVYSNWLEDNGVPYAGSVSISRPVDGYSLRVEMQEPGINQPLPEDAFLLEPPDGVEVERVGEKDDTAAQAEAR